MPDRERFDFDAEYGRRYDEIVRMVVPGYEHLFPMVHALFRERLGARAHVLVVGAGSGSELVTFAGAEPGWQLTGVEPSSQMGRIARGKLEAAGLEDRVALHHGYTDGLPAVERYDAATLICVMHFLPDDGGKLALLRSIAQRLAPGAPLALVDGHGAPGTAAFDTRFAGWMRFAQDMGMTDEELAVYRAQLDGSVHWSPERRILALLEEAGFGEAVCFYRAFVFGGWVALKR